MKKDTPSERRSRRKIEKMAIFLIEKWGFVQKIDFSGQKPGFWGQNSINIEKNVLAIGCPAVRRRRILNIKKRPINWKYRAFSLYLPWNPQKVGGFQGKSRKTGNIFKLLGVLLYWNYGRGTYPPCWEPPEKIAIFSIFFNKIEFWVQKPSRKPFFWVKTAIFVMRRCSHTPSQNGFSDFTWNVGYPLGKIRFFCKNLGFIENARHFP